MRVLIVGGGVAGLTLAAKLKQQGRNPVVIERVPDYTEAGFNISLYPSGSAVLHGLGLYSEYEQVSQLCESYQLCDGHANVLQTMEFEQFAGEFGPVRNTSHEELVRVLLRGCDGIDLRMGTTLAQIEDTGDVVNVEFSDGSTGEFDVVIGADGLHSQVRELVFGQHSVHDTGWVLRAAWADAGIVDPTQLREYWGTGFFIGVFPVKGRVAVCIGGRISEAPAADAPDDEVMAYLGRITEPVRTRSPEFQALFDTYGPKTFQWFMADQRSEALSKGRVALVGDAGTAFLPTAGVGATNAMRTAAALADELSLTGAFAVPPTLERYVRRTEKIVRANQEDSRRLAKAIFIKSSTEVHMRDLILRHYPVERMAKEVVASMKMSY